MAFFKRRPRKRLIEEPCEVTDKACSWVFFDEDEEIENPSEFDLYMEDLICSKCFRSRDPERDEFPEE